MLRVIINVTNLSNNDNFDLEVPAEITLKQLFSLIAKALKWKEHDPELSIIREKWSNNPLPLNETLASLNLWDGTSLIFEPVFQFISNIKIFLVSIDSKRKYEIVQDFYYIGRSSKHSKNPDNFIDLGAEKLGKTVSRLHAILRFQQNNWFLQPLSNTKNPTIHNGKILPPEKSVILQNEDIIQIGGVRLKFYYEKTNV